jgi:hypothetical protein
MGRTLGLFYGVTSFRVGELVVATQWEGGVCGEIRPCAKLHDVKIIVRYFRDIRLG